MPILNYTTKIESSKTVGEIQQILASHGCRKIVMDYDDNGEPVALTFSILLKDQPLFYSLPCNWQGVYKAMCEDKDVPNKYISTDQAKRTAWRILKTWVEAQLAIVEAQLVTMAEVFLPYAVTKSGNTLYQEIAQGNNQMLLHE